MTDLGNLRCHNNSSLDSLTTTQDFRVTEKDSQLHVHPLPPITSYQPAIINIKYNLQPILT